MLPRLTAVRLHLLRLTHNTGVPPSAAELARELQIADASASLHLRALRKLSYVEPTGTPARTRTTR